MTPKNTICLWFDKDAHDAARFYAARRARAAGARTDGACPGRSPRARFVQDAKAVSALNHPNIVTVHDIGTEGDVAYLVMELVDGQTLEQLVPAGGMRVPEVLRIGAQVAEACARAHPGGGSLRRPHGSDASDGPD